jgi:hypothetical protein
MASIADGAFELDRNTKEIKYVGGSGKRVTLSEFHNFLTYMESEEEAQDLIKTLEAIWDRASA